jgi:hypothetical protein
MSRRWLLLLWLPMTAGLAFEIMWVIRTRWIFDHLWLSPLAYFLGIIMMLAGRPRVTEGQLEHALMAGVILAYGLSLGFIICGMAFVMELYNPFGIFSVLLLAPFAWVGVNGSARGEWVRSIGAWLVLSGLFTFFMCMSRVFWLH